MNTVVFDIETNAIKNFSSLLGLKTVHCIGLSTNGEEPQIFSGSDIEEALEKLRLADVIVGHNIQDFDIRALKRIYPDWNPEGSVRDTLIMCKMLWPDIQNEDWQMPDFPKNLLGRQSLKAWGVRLGIHKGDYGSAEDCWDEFTDEMAKYCLQDVRVTQHLWERVKAEEPPDHPTVLEHEFAAIISQQERNGFAFDVDAARSLHSSLVEEKDRLHRALEDSFPPQIIEMKSPSYYFDPVTKVKYDYKKFAPKNIQRSLLRGEVRTKKISFNPGSRDHIARGLSCKYGWEPGEYTGSGRPKIDEAVLSSLNFPEIKDLIKYLTVVKRLGQVADGKESWIKLEKDGRIYGKVNSCGAVTARCTHSRPNLAQVPRVGAWWGGECRSLFHAPGGSLLVGVDMSGLELRCLAHYTYPSDGGKYAADILSGDIHSVNQEAAGLPSRDLAKTFIYALLYGAGDAKIGAIIGGGAREGAALKRTFNKKIPALKKLQDGIQYRFKSQGYLTGIDGRKLKIRSPHSALNTLLQSAGAIAMKEATCLFHRNMCSRGWPADDVLQVAHVHDEVQFQVREDIADEVGRYAVHCMQEAGKSLGFRCELDGEYRVGRNWAETH